MVSLLLTLETKPWHPVVEFSISKFNIGLLVEPRLKYAKAMELSQSMEAAERNPKAILP